MGQPAAGVSNRSPALVSDPPGVRARWLLEVRVAGTTQKGAGRYCSVSLLIFHLLKGYSSVGDFGEGLRGSGDSHEWFRVVVVGLQVVLNRGNEVIHTVEDASADDLVGQIPKPSFD